MQYQRLNGKSPNASLLAQQLDEQRTIESINAMLADSIWASQRIELAQQHRSYVAMCVAMLIDQQLINDDGLPVGLCSLVARLCYIEPGSFFITHLFKSNRWSELVADWEPV